MPLKIPRKLTPFIRAALRCAERSHAASVEIRSVRNFVLMPHSTRLGPLVLLTELIEALRTTLPDARVIVAGSGMALDLFRMVDGLERLVEVPDPRQDLRGSIRALRAQRFYAGEPYITLLPLGSARVEYRLAAWLSGAPATVDIAGSRRVSTSCKWERSRSRVANCLQLIEALGHGPALWEQLNANPELWEPVLTVRDEYKAAARQLLAAEGFSPDRPYAVLVTQSSPTPPRSWRPEHFREMATWLHQQHGLQIVFTGAKTDREGVARVRDPLSFPTADLSGKTALGELAALMQGARLALTLDTGTMHIGRAVKLPMVVIHAATEPPMEWLPLGVDRMPVLLNVPQEAGSPFELPGELKPEAVQATLQQLLEQFPNGADPARS